MPYLQKLNTPDEDVTVSDLHKGSTFLACGWTLLGMAILLSIYIFIDFREGTKLMSVWVGAIGTLGLVLIGVGEVKRSHSI